jgi:hypothetical protein
MESAIPTAGTAGYPPPLPHTLEALQPEMPEKTKLLADRRKALEEEFFKKHNERLAAELRLKRLTEEAKAEIGRASGIRDEAVLDKLVDLGIGAPTLAAMTLVPVVEVAWADGKMDDGERGAILRAAEEEGIARGTPSFALLEDWLRNRPPPRLLSAWRDYVGALCEEMLPQDRRKLKSEVLSRARAVAKAAGGFLGLGSKVSAEEAKVFGILETAFKV